MGEWVKRNGEITDNLIGKIGKRAFFMNKDGGKYRRKWEKVKEE